MQSEFSEEQILILSNRRSTYFAKLVKDKLIQSYSNTTELGIEYKTFPGGEHYYRINVSKPMGLFGKDCIYVATLVSDEDFLEAFRIVDTLASLGSRSRTLVIPYLGYSVMKEQANLGDVSASKANAMLFSTISNYGLGNCFYFLDLHVKGFLNYLEGSASRTHLEALNLLCAAMEQNGLITKDTVFSSANIAIPERVNRIADKYGCNLAFVRKPPPRELGLIVESILTNLDSPKDLHSIEPPVILPRSSKQSNVQLDAVKVEEEHATGAAYPVAMLRSSSTANLHTQRLTKEEQKAYSPLVGNVAGKPVVIYEDMIRSGTTIIYATFVLWKNGAKSVDILCSHLCANEDTLKYLIQTVCKSSFV